VTDPPIFSYSLAIKPAPKEVPFGVNITKSGFVQKEGSP